MIRAWRAWVALMDRREPATALAMVRIGIAIVLLADYLWTWHLGMVEPLWSPPPTGFALAHPPWCGLSGSALAVIATVALVAIGLGAATRIACITFVLASAQLATLAPEGESASDQLMRIVIAILALSQSHARWSVDAWIARRRGPAQIPAWPRYLIMLQLVWMYFSAGHNKGEVWGPFGGFTALANTLSDPHSARWDPAWLATMYPLTRVATALTMVFELGAPLYLLFHYYAATADRPGRLRAWCNRYRLRWIWIGLGLSFELGIAVTMKLGSFPFAMLAVYPVFLLPRELDLRSSLRAGSVKSDS